MDKCRYCTYWEKDGELWGCSKHRTSSSDPDQIVCDDFEAFGVAEDIEDDENAVYRLTEAFILYDLLSKDAGFNVGGWKPWLWESICNEFMTRLEKAGYIGKTEE